MLYTDGLVERRGTDIGDGMNKLRARIEQHRWDEDLDAMCHAVTDEMVGEDPDDDRCLLVLRT